MQGIVGGSWGDVKRRADRILGQFGRSILNHFWIADHSEVSQTRQYKRVGRY
jgi:hypothetical protein